MKIISCILIIFLTTSYTPKQKIDEKRLLKEVKGEIAYRKDITNVVNGLKNLELSLKKINTNLVKIDSLNYGNYKQ